MIKIFFDLLLRANFFVVILIFTSFNLLFFNIPFFSINKNDEIFSAIDISISTALLFSLSFSSYIVNKFIIDSVQNRSFFNIKVKPFGAIKFIGICFLTIIMASLFFYTSSFSVYLYHRFLFDSFTLDTFFYYLQSHFLSIIFSSFIVPISLYLRSQAALLINIFIFIILNIIPFDIFDLRNFHAGDAIFLEISLPQSYMILIAVQYFLIFFMMYLLSVAIFTMREVE